LGGGGLLLLDGTHASVLALVHPASHGTGCCTNSGIANDCADSSSDHSSPDAATSGRSSLRRWNSSGTWHIASGLRRDGLALGYVNLGLLRSLASERADVRRRRRSGSAGPLRREILRWHWWIGLRQSRRHNNCGQSQSKNNAHDYLSFWHKYIIERTETAIGQKWLGRSKRFAERQVDGAAIATDGEIEADIDAILA
jgi:hypothetical protein